MQARNKISDVTRQHISDEMLTYNIWYYGRITEPDFLARLFDLKRMSSRDDRYDNAYDDINQHMVNNNDWEPDWLYTDSRIDLLHVPDDLYLSFLSLTIHPRMRTNKDETTTLLEIYNRHLAADGYEIIQMDDISGKPVYGARQRTLGQGYSANRSMEIVKYLNTEYVSRKIKMMTEALDRNSDLAIGTAKELLETTCKSILSQNKVTIDPQWTLGQLVKNTTNNLNFAPTHAEDPEKAEKSIRQILGGISSLIQGISELRNSYGTGHGKHPDFQGLETRYAKLFVGVVSEIVILYLSVNGENAKLVEVEDQSNEADF